MNFGLNLNLVLDLNYNINNKMKKATMNNSSIKSINKKQNVSDIMINETKKMEEKLELVKKMMELEKNKRS